MKKIVINENERGILFKDGKLVGALGAGRYRTSKRKNIEIVSVSEGIASDNAAVEKLLENKEIASQTTSVEVGDEQIAFHYVNGKLAGGLGSGTHAFWNAAGIHEFRIFDTSDPEIPADVTPSMLSKISPAKYWTVDVSECERAKLYYDNKLVRVLEQGRYCFWRNGVQVSVERVDMRLQQMTVVGQEMLTQDKVELRISFVCSFRVTDFIRVTEAVDDYKEQMRVAVQLALREYVGKYKLDDVLANKDEMTAFVFERLKAKCGDLYVEVADAGVKDIILPGEIRSIMNTVLVAEKRAQANVITRREEVASTRSLLNTAKLMDENATLYRLKELEYIEKISENVGSVNLSGGSDILGQLLSAVGGGKRNETAKETSHV